MKLSLSFAMISCFLFISPKVLADFPYEEDTLKLDSSIRHGKLPNGFSYYLKSQPNASSKLYMNFYIKAGSENESKNEREAAHLLEHLAVHLSRKSRPQNLKKNGIVKGSFSGSTSLSYTKYSFQADHNNHLAFKSGLTWIKDIASGFEIRESEVMKEKEVLVEELLYRNGDNLEEHFLDSRLKGAINPCRKGKAETLEYGTLNSQKVQNFYNKWYRPDLMAINIVGEIENIDRLEGIIKEQFSGIETKSDSANVENCQDQYFSQSPQFVSLARDINKRKSDSIEPVQIRLFYRDSIMTESLDRWKGLKRKILWNILVDILGNRLRNESERYLANYEMKAVYSGNTESWPPSLILTINSYNNSQRQALLTAVKYLEQLKEYGVLEAEWPTAKQTQLYYYNFSKNEKPGYWMEEIRKHFVNGEALPANKKKILHQWLTNLTLEEFNQLLPDLLKESPEDIGIISPAGHKSLNYTLGKFRSWIKEGNNKASQPYRLAEVPETLIEPNELEYLKPVGFQEKFVGRVRRELELANGIKVILYPFSPVNGLDDENIIVRGFRLAGANCYPDKDYFSAINAPAIIQNTGTSNMNKFQLKDYLSQTGIWQGVVPYVNYKESGIQGKSPQEDMETLFQLLYMFFTSPGKNKASFEDWKFQNHLSSLDPPFNLIHSDFKEAIQSLTSDKSTNPIGTRRFQGIEKTEFERAHQIYRDLFGRADEFTFLISGKYESEELIPLVQKYLGNLPNSNSKINCNSGQNDKKILLKGPISNEVKIPGNYKLENVKYGIRFLQNNQNVSWKEKIRVKALGKLLSLNLPKLRYEKNYALYDFTGGGRYNEELKRFEINLQITCGTSELSAIKKESYKIIEEIKQGRGIKKFFPHLIEYLNFIYSENKLGSHRMVQNRLYQYYRYKGEWIAPDVMQEYINSLTPEDLKVTANKYFKDENLIEFVMKN